MKLLLSVIMTLLQINGVIALLLVLFVISMRDKKTEMIMNISQLDHNSEDFRRNLQDADSDYQKQIQQQQQEIESKDQELRQVKTELELVKNSQSIVKTPYNLAKSESSKATKTATSTDHLAGSKSSNAQKEVTRTTTASRQTPKRTSSVMTQGSPKTRSQSTIATNKTNSLSSAQATHTPKSSNWLQSGTLFSVTTQEHKIVNHPSEQNTSRWTMALNQLSSPPSINLSIEDPFSITKSNRMGSKTTQEELINTKLNKLLESTQKTEESPQELSSRLPESKKLVVTTDPSKKETPRDQAIRLANDLSIGLVIAHQKRQIKYGTGTYRQVQTAIRSLRRGTSLTLEQASRRANLESSVLNQVAKWGENRPGSFGENAQISLVDTHEPEEELNEDS